MNHFMKRAAVISGMVYASSLLYRAMYPTPKMPPLTVDQMRTNWAPRTRQERGEVFERLAPQYDHLVFQRESGSVFVHKRQLLNHARGKVIEVGVGTANYLDMYNAEQVDSVLAVDDSPAMLQEAQRH